MFDLSWMTQRFQALPTTQKRVLVLVDKSSADVKLLAKIAPPTGLPPEAIVWLWVVTPGAVVSWGALLAEPGDRTRLLLSALGERMEEARRTMLPLKNACHAAAIPCQTHILHGTVVESVVRLARAEQNEQVLLATTGGAIYGQPPQELASLLASRLAVPVGILG